MCKLATRVMLLAAIVVPCSSGWYPTPAPTCVPGQDCPSIHRPVCGTDGVTYNSLCVLESATCGSGVSVAHRGVCAKTTTALPCIPRQHCPSIHRPVCGTDGVTYNSLCFLESKTCGRGVSVAHRGACARTTDLPCIFGMPCTYQFDPVCGSDGLTYDSLCVLLSATCGSGVTVAYKGECLRTTTPSLCVLGQNCPSIHRPVCGTDGVTYNSLCFLESKTCGSGVSVAHRGVCARTTARSCFLGQPCRFLRDPVCGSDGVTYVSPCALESETCGSGVTVAYKGECVETPTATPCNPIADCPLLYDPVCGSDGVNYQNKCVLKSETCGKHVTVAHRGKCIKAIPSV